MINKPELPEYVRDAEIEYALSHMGPHKSSKGNESGVPTKTRPTEAR